MALDLGILLVAGDDDRGGRCLGAGLRHGGFLCGLADVADSGLELADGQEVEVGFLPRDDALADEFLDLAAPNGGVADADDFGEASSETVQEMGGFLFGGSRRGDLAGEAALTKGQDDVDPSRASKDGMLRLVAESPIPGSVSILARQHRRVVPG